MAYKLLKANPFYGVNTKISDEVYERLPKHHQKLFSKVEKISCDKKPLTYDHASHSVIADLAEFWTRMEEGYAGIRPRRENEPNVLLDEVLEDDEDDDNDDDVEF